MMIDETHNINYLQVPLIKLTQVSNPLLNNGEPTICAVDPKSIVLIYRGFCRWNDIDGSPIMDAIEATTVQTCIGHHLSVLETPEEIALLRNKALGITESLKVLK